MKSSLSLVVLLASAGCIWAPNSLTTHESTASISMSGWTQGASKTIAFSTKDAQTGTWTSQGTATSSTSANPYDSSLYSWAHSLTPGAAFWSPQVTYSYGGKSYTALRTGPGRLELKAEVDGDPLYTYTEAAQDCWYDHHDAGETVTEAGAHCADGTSLVLFDNSGVGSPPETTGWTTIPGKNGSGSVFGANIEWSIVSYQVQGHTVHGLICHPQGTGPYPVQIINHGGYGGLDETISLSYCQRAAARGWLVGMSAYRGEAMSFPGLSYSVGPNIDEMEVCLGEVIDVLRLTELLRADAKADPSRVLMWGHSHGACITERAVEQGAPVDVAAAFAAPTDFPAWYAYCGLSGSPCSGTPGDLRNGLGGSPTAAPAAYAWRSPITFASDLATRKDIKFLALQGTADTVVFPSQACAMAKQLGGTNWHRTAGGATTTTAPTSPYTDGSCTTTPTTLTWSAGAVPGASAGAWADARNLVVYDGLAHDTIVQNGVFPGFPATQSWLDFEAFVQSQGLPQP